MKAARIGAALVLALFAVGAVRLGIGLETQARVGRPAPDFTLETLTGDRVQLNELRGRPVLLNFWASWCPPCIDEAPALQAVFDRYGDRLELLGINQREAQGAMRAFRDQFDLSYPLLMDPGGRINERYNVRALPETWLIDADGKAVAHHVGQLTFEHIQQLYEGAIGESLDGTGVGAVRSGERAIALAVSADNIFVATASGVKAAPLSGPAAPEYDDAAAWVELGLDKPVNALAVRTTMGGNGRQVVAATDDGLWLWDGTWRRAGLAGTLVGGLAFAERPGPDKGVAALAWVPGSGLLSAGNGLDGEAELSWQPLATNLDEDLPWLALWSDPAVPGRWLAGYGAGLLESTDDGQTWRTLGPEREVRAIAGYAAGGQADHGGSQLYLATDRGVWVSSDGGRSAVSTAVPVRLFTGLAATPSGGLLALAPNGDLVDVAAAGF